MTAEDPTIKWEDYRGTMTLLDSERLTRDYRAGSTGTRTKNEWWIGKYSPTPCMVQPPCLSIIEAPSISNIQKKFLFHFIKPFIRASHTYNMPLCHSLNQTNLTDAQPPITQVIDLPNHDNISPLKSNALAPRTLRKHPPPRQRREPLSKQTLLIIFPSTQRRLRGWIRIPTPLPRMLIAVISHIQSFT